MLSIHIFVLATSAYQYDVALRLIEENSIFLDPLLVRIVKGVTNDDEEISSLTLRIRLESLIRNLDIVEAFPDQIAMIYEASTCSLEAFRQNPDLFDNNIANVRLYNDFFDGFCNKKLVAEEIRDTVGELLFQMHGREKYISAKVRDALELLKKITSNDREKISIFLKLDKAGMRSPYLYTAMGKWHELFGNDFDKFKQVVNVISDFHARGLLLGISKGFEVAIKFIAKNIRPQTIQDLSRACDLAYSLHEVPFKNRNKLLSELDFTEVAKKYHSLLKKYCKLGDPLKSRLLIQYIEYDLPFNETAINIYFELGLKDQGPVNLDEFADRNANMFMSLPNWHSELLDLYNVQALRGHHPAWLKIIFGMLDRVNVNAVRAMLVTHFAQFNLKGTSVDQRMFLMKEYCEFLLEYNGTFSTLIWELYFLLRNPKHADLLKNVKHLNKVREIENISGINDLRSKINDIKGDILSDKVDLEKYLSSDLSLAVLDDVTKFSASEWKLKNKPLKNVVSAFLKSKDNSEPTLDSRGYRSGVIKTTVVLKKKERDPALTIMAAKIQSAVKSLFSSRNPDELLPENEIFETVKACAVKKIQNESMKLQLALKKYVDEDPNSSIIDFIRNHIDHISKYLSKLQGASNLSDLTSIMLSKKIKDLDFDEEVCLIFYYHGAKIQDLSGTTSWINANAEEVDSSKVEEFILDTIFAEVLSRNSRQERQAVSLTNAEIKQIRYRFSGITNFLSENRKHNEEYKKRAASTEKKVTIIANRGILAELSGYYCDACWTWVPNIVKDNPSLVGYTMVYDFEDNERSRVIGGALTLESRANVKYEDRDQTGDAKVIIVRGLNPQDDVINNMRVDVFVENFLDYIRDIAVESGAEYVVLPLHNIGALSNRPAIIDYLMKTYEAAKIIKLKDDIRFNGYAIQNSCIIVRDVRRKRKDVSIPNPTKASNFDKNRSISSL